MAQNKSGCIPLIRSTFYQEEITKAKLASFILNSSRLSMGEKCLEFEKEFSLFQDRLNTVLFNSGSSANLALIQALLNMGRLRKGDKVAFSALTWSTNVMPLIQLGLKPIPVDVELETLNVGSREFSAVLAAHPDIKAFFISNLLGFCSDLDALRTICQSRGILFLEDNCESLGTVYQSKKLGNFGIASTCSLYVGHHLSAIEGGVVCTDDPDLHRMLAMVRAHGWDRNLNPDHQLHLRKEADIDPFYDLYTFYELAFNLRPTEITGFLGLEELRWAHQIVAKRVGNFGQFHEAAARNTNILPLKTHHIDCVSNFAYPVVCRDKASFMRYKEKFLQNNIEVRPIVGGNIAKQPFFKKYSDDVWELPHSDFIHEHGFYFPNNPELTDGEIKRITDLLRESEHD